MHKWVEETFKEFNDLFTSFKTTEQTVERSNVPPDNRPVEGGGSSSVMSSRWRTRTNEMGLVLEVDLPGDDPKALELSVTTKQVILTGTHSNNVKFTHRYTISRRYNTMLANAKYVFGELFVYIPFAYEDDVTPTAIKIDGI